MKSMKPLLFLFVTGIALTSCQNKKIENLQTVDSLITDTTQNVTTLAFDPLDHYTLKKNVKLPDSVNFLLIGSELEFDNLFEANSKEKQGVVQPDFIINHTVAIISGATDKRTTIEIEKVEIDDNSINVFTKVTRGEKENALTTPARVFAIERRDGLISVDFYQNGKMMKSFMLIL
jgi:hypothetical protein